MGKDAIQIIIAITMATVAIIAINKNDSAALRAEIRANANAIAANAVAIAELRGLVLGRGGHVADATVRNLDPVAKENSSE